MKVEFPDGVGQLERVERLLLVLQVPEEQMAAPAASGTGDEKAFGMEAGAPRHALVPRQRVAHQQLSGLPLEPQDERLVHRAEGILGLVQSRAGEMLSVRAEREAPHAAEVHPLALVVGPERLRVERPHPLARSGLPLVNQPAQLAREDELPGGMEEDAVDVALVTDEGPEQRAGRQVPELHGAVVAGAREDFAVGTDRQGADPAVMRLDLS